MTRTSWLVTLFCGGMLITLTMGFRQGFGLFLPPIAETLGSGRELVALAIAAQNLVWGLSSPIFGGLADRFGPKPVAAAGGVLYALGLAVMGLASGGGDIMAGQVLVGLGLGGAGFSVVLGTVGRAAPAEKRSLALGVVTAAGSFGQFALVPVEQSLMEAFGWSDALLGLAVAALVMVFFAFGLNTKKGGTVTGAYEQSLRQALGEALAHKSFLLLSLGFFVCGFQVVFVATHLPAFLRDQGLDPSVAAWALALVGLFNIIGSLGAGWIGGRISQRTSLVWFYLMRSLIILGFILLPITPMTAMAFGALLGIFWLGTVPLTSGLIVTFFGPRYLSMLYGIVFVSHQVGSFLGAWYGGYLYDTYGSYDVMWWLTIASGVAAAAVHALIRETPSARLAEEAA